MSYYIEIQARNSFGGQTTTVGNYSTFSAALAVATDEVKWESTQEVRIMHSGEVIASSEGDYADAPAGAEEPASAEAGHDYAVVERAEGFDMDWYYDGAGWSSQPVYYFSTMEAAYRHAAERRQENEFPVYSYHVVIRGENEEAA